MVVQAQLNFVAILVAAIISISIGMFWYSRALFGPAWMRLSGRSAKDMNKVKKKMASGMFINLIATLIMSYVLWRFILYLNASTIAVGLQAAFWIWLGFVAPVMIGMVLWEGKPWKLYFINVAYQLVSLAVMAAILVLWH